MYDAEIKIYVYFLLFIWLIFNIFVYWQVSPLMNVFSQYIWVVFIITGIMSALKLRHRVQPYINTNHSLAEGYNILIWSRCFFFVAPWTVVALGCMSGKTDILDFLQPYNFNPVVLSFFALTLIEFLILFFWIFVGNGAVFLKRYPLAIQSLNVSNAQPRKLSTTAIKKIFTPFLIIYFISFAILWILGLPVFRSIHPLAAF
jgi:hypothetical protein